jgi:hypothetical protein
MTLLDVLRIYDGSDGAATTALYAALETHGPAGVVAVNLFRAQKASARAKVYRGGLPGKGSYRGLAYERKQWSLNNLGTVLGQHATALGLAYGWQFDPETGGFPWVLYVDLPSGQVSFHAPARGQGPDYPGVWDGVRDAAAGRICVWIAMLCGLESV